MPFGFPLAVDTLPSSASTAEARGAFPPLLEMAPPIRAPVGLQPTCARGCPAHPRPSADFCGAVREDASALSPVPGHTADPPG